MKIYRGEAGYLDLMRDILRDGVETPDRTGVGRKKLFGVTWACDLRAGVPAFTVRNNNPVRQAFEEFWFFLNGRVDTKELEAKNVKFWQGNTSRAFLDKRGLTDLPEGHYGKSYGFQLRNFGGDLDPSDNFNPAHPEHLTAYCGHDQIDALYRGLVDDPYGSRHCVTMWNPLQLHEMALPPCWYDHQFVMLPGTLTNGHRPILNLRVTARSCDVLFGTPMNVFQYAIYLKAFAHLLHAEAGELVVIMTDAHLYGNQYAYAEETLTREIYQAPQVTIETKFDSFDDFLNLQWEDIQLHGYVVNDAPYTAERPPMAV